MFRGWFNASVSNYNGFIRALLRGNVKEMNIYMMRSLYLPSAALTAESILRENLNRRDFIMVLS